MCDCIQSCSRDFHYGFSGSTRTLNGVSSGGLSSINVRMLDAEIVKEFLLQLWIIWEKCCCCTLRCKDSQWHDKPLFENCSLPSAWAVQYVKLWCDFACSVKWCPLVSVRSKLNRLIIINPMYVNRALKGLKYRKSRIYATNHKSHYNLTYRTDKRKSIRTLLKRSCQATQNVMLVYSFAWSKFSYHSFSGWVIFDIEKQS